MFSSRIRGFLLPKVTIAACIIITGGAPMINLVIVIIADALMMQGGM